MHLKITLKASKLRKCHCNWEKKQRKAKVSVETAKSFLYRFKKTSFHPISNLELIYPTKEENLVKADENLSHKCEELDTWKIQAKFFSENFQRSIGYYQSQLISHEWKVCDDKLRALPAKRNFNNLREENACFTQSIKEEFKHFKKYVYNLIFQMGHLVEAQEDHQGILWMKRFPRKNEHYAATVWGSRPNAPCKPDATPIPTPASKWQKQDPPSEHLHPVTAGPPQEQNRAHPGAPCAGRCSELSFSPTLPPGHSIPGPGSSSPVRGQMLQKSPGGRFLRKWPPVPPLILKNEDKSPQNPLYWGTSLTQHIFQWQKKCLYTKFEMILSTID